MYRNRTTVHFFFINLFILCIYFWLCWVFVAAHRLSLVVVSGGYSSFWCMGSRCSGFSSCGLQALECRLSSCGSRASLLRSMWDLPRPGIEPVSPAFTGRFLTTVPPGKSLFVFLMLGCMRCLYTLDINPLSVVSFANVFSHSVVHLLSFSFSFFNIFIGV